MKLKIACALALCLVMLAGCGTAPQEEQPEAEPTTDISHDNVMIELWEANAIAFGVFVPNEAPRPPGEGEARVQQEGEEDRGLRRCIQLRVVKSWRGIRSTISSS